MRHFHRTFVRRRLVVDNTTSSLRKRESCSLEGGGIRLMDYSFEEVNWGISLCCAILSPLSSVDKDASNRRAA